MKTYRCILELAMSMDNPEFVELTAAVAGVILYLVPGNKFIK